MWGAALFITSYQYAKSGSKTEYLHGICFVSMTPIVNRAGYPVLSENLRTRRCLVLNVVQVCRLLLVQLDATS